MQHVTKPAIQAWALSAHGAAFIPEHQDGDAMMCVLGLHQKLSVIAISNIPSDASLGRAQVSPTRNHVLTRCGSPERPSPPLLLLW